LKLVDAHIHLSDPEYAQHTDEVITDAKNSGVNALVSNATDLGTSLASLELREGNPNLVYTALGIHPWNVNILKASELEDTLKLIQDQAQKKTIVAIGEIGLDSKYEKTWEKQLEVFDKMLQMAEKVNLPVIVHSRGTTERIVDMLPSYKLKNVLLHWFSYPLAALSKAVEHGYCITEGPPTVYSSGIREVIEQVPLTNLLTETDGPVKYYKQPFNGQLTKPSFVRLVVEAVAEIKRMNAEKIADQIATNFENFFSVKLS
jgi:TatD DNase family protein